MNNDSVTYCSRCGSEMKSDSRYCMKCGNLNPDHPENEGMLKYYKENNSTYTIGMGKKLVNNQNSNSISTLIGTNMGSYKLCFLINIVIYLIICGGILLSTYITNNNGIMGLVKSNVYVSLLTVSIIFIYVYSYQLLYMKMNQRWWSSLIPFYNFFILSKALFNNMLLGLLMFVPFINILFYIYILYSIAKAFKKNVVLTILFPFIMIPIIGFGASCFNNNIYLSSQEKSLEDDYKLRKKFLMTIVFFVVAGIALFLYNFIFNIGGSAGKVKSSYLYTVSKIAIDNTKNKVSHNKYSCNNTEVMYFYYENVSLDMYVPFSNFFDNVSAYVKVVNNGNGYDYYVSISDGKYGFSETLEKDLSSRSVVEYELLSDSYKTNMCSFQ